jgi:hypothetical protein
MERDSELSAREDLHEQLLRQQSVHRQLKGELRKEAEATDQYLELLIQLQRNGKFFQPRAHLGRQAPSCSEEVRTEEENGILRMEIRALSLQLDRVASDKADLERGRDISAWKARRSIKEMHSADELDEEERSFKKRIAEMEDALRQARNSNRALTLLVTDDRKHVEDLNGELMTLLSSTDQTCDLDLLVRSSVEMYARLRQERSAIEEVKEERSRARRDAVLAPHSRSREKNRALSREEAERALHVLAASPGARGSADALRKLCLGLMCAVRQEEENARRMAAHNRHLFKRLDRLRSRVAEVDPEEEPRPEPTRCEAPRIAEAAVAFEQPASGSHDWLLRSLKLSSTSML